MDHNGYTTRLLSGGRMPHIPIHPEERPRHYRAFTDFCSLGPARVVRELHEKYAELMERYEAGEEDVQKPPTASFVTLRKWSSRFDWMRRSMEYDLAVDAELQAEAAEEIRINREQWKAEWAEWRDDALDLAKQLRDKARAALSVPLTQEVETVDPQTGTKIVIMPTKRWGLGTVTQLVKTANELMEVATGHQRQPVGRDEVIGNSDKTTNITGNTEQVIDDEEFDRAYTALANALRDFIPQSGDEQDGSMDSPEPTAVDGDSNEG